MPLQYVIAAFGVVAVFVFLRIARQPPPKADHQLSYHQLAGIRHARIANEKAQSHQTLQLADGRSLGYAVYGASSGPTVFFLHGFGDCRLTGALFDKPANNLGIRVVSIDRPGWGRSSMQLGRCALDLAQDLQELAAHLDVKMYSIIAVSGGGPYALACAYALPAAQLKSVVLLCAAGPWALTMRNSRWFAWSFWQLTLLSPPLMRWLAARLLAKYRNMTKVTFIANTRRQYQGWLARWPGLSEQDIAIMQNEDFLALLFQGLSENCRRDVRGVMDELRVLTTSDLGFRLEDIRKDLRVDLWYGTQDANVSWRVGEALEKCIGGKAKLRRLNETHLGLLLNRTSEVLERAVERVID